jgi:rSAM/selenodomain-associated transferase 1
MPDTALVIMARYPEVGTTKTRLARTIGDAEAVRLYQAFISDLARKFAGQTCDLHWAYTPAEVDFLSFIATLAPSFMQHMHSFPQQGADFGARLHHVFRWTNDRGYQRTIVIGSDTPQIGLEIVAQARKALDTADVVLGPADDGGYYLIAMRRPNDVFRDIPMSTSVVAQMTIELAESQALKLYTLENLFDVDELPDLLRLAKLLEADNSLAPTTATCLAAIKELV